MDSPSVFEKQGPQLTLTSVPGRPTCPNSTERLYSKKETNGSWQRNGTRIDSGGVTLGMFPNT